MTCFHTTVVGANERTRLTNEEEYATTLRNIGIVMGSSPRVRKAIIATGLLTVGYYTLSSPRGVMAR